MGNETFYGNGLSIPRYFGCSWAVVIASCFSPTSTGCLFSNVHGSRLKMPCDTKFLQIGDLFSVSRKLIFAIRTDCFFLVGNNFCDLQKVPDNVLTLRKTMPKVELFRRPTKLSNCSWKVKHFYHEPVARGIGRPPPVYLTLNKLSYLILSYLIILSYLAQLSSSEWVRIVQHVLPVCFRRIQRLRACLHGVGDPGLVGLVSFVFTLWGTQNKRNLPH